MSSHLLTPPLDTDSRYPASLPTQARPTDCCAVSSFLLRIVGHYRFKVAANVRPTRAASVDRRGRDNNRPGRSEGELRSVWLQKGRHDEDVLARGSIVRPGAAASTPQFHHELFPSAFTRVRSAESKIRCAMRRGRHDEAALGVVLFQSAEDVSGRLG